MLGLKYDNILNYRRLTRLFNRGILLCVLLLAVGETAIFLQGYGTGAVADFKTDFLSRVLYPTLFNLGVFFAVFLITRLCLKYKKTTLHAFATTLGVSLICLSLVSAHYQDRIIFAILVFPLITALHYIDKKPLLLAYLFNLLGYLLLAFFLLPRREGALAARQGAVEIFTMVIFITVAYVLCRWLLGTLAQLVLNIRRKDALMRLDPFTKLLNHNSFYEYLDRFILENRNKGTIFSLILWDLDNFKEINDNYGHDMGDKVLLAFAGALRKNVGRQGCPFRFGGDEFAVLLRANDRGAEKLAEKVKEDFEKNLSGLPLKTPSTASAGICQYNPSCQNGSRDFFSAADYVLYRAKRQAGKNKINTWSISKYG